MLTSSSYYAVEDRVAWGDLSGRVRLEVGGPDRAKFLHNLTTNEVKRLPVGRGCEAFVTSLQGKTLAYVKLLACADSILVCADTGGLLLALPHFQKYGVFDEITLEDRSESTFEFHLAGPKVDELVRQAGGDVPESIDLAHRATTLADCPLLVIRESPTGRPGLTLIGPRGGAARVLGILRLKGQDLGLAELDPECFEVLRLEAGTPVFGRDVTEKNLPQEIGRDDRAINFVKGCYLGQETVARIDALGHVNQVMRGLRLDPVSPCPAPGAVALAEGKRVGFVTSSAFSPGWNSPIALALVRTTHARSGAELIVQEPEHGGAAVATVCALPMIPRSRSTPTP
jgi:tRNA-modifying protein YgfZ